MDWFLVASDVTQSDGYVHPDCPGVPASSPMSRMGTGGGFTLELAWIMHSSPAAVRQCMVCVVAQARFSVTDIDNQFYLRIN
jgi:hypothetical protein